MMTDQTMPWGTLLLSLWPIWLILGAMVACWMVER